MPTNVDHIDVRTPDLDGTLAFLTKLGFKELRRLDGARGSVEVALPGEGQVVFEVRPEPSAAQAYVHHVAFKIGGPGDISTLEQAGVPFTKTNHFVEATGRTVSNSVDPGGMTWQFTD
ncbi:VOC family protein [Rhodococcoides kyotonense]|uniref:Glyoxalase/Bleomycin resistance protein/Dioxygenase superfamily protein n=1 Tax=Rhodococcoides kyotonense TaxID=398843 RepID=A0A239N1R9_9NOCA|nr:VOC family protein [Rhodococcus kyotonensis]SNT48710.1 Glyoxalase/Bleomycin resistance protein/Dioxygenase superfamily protein [Rhodococcus kyotonensis]